MTYCPPHEPQVYEFTALSGSEILDAGDLELSCGDCFYMPPSANVCVTVTDNDGSLSGDAYNNEMGDDQSWQIADIEVDGLLVHDDEVIYAEEYYVLHGDDGQCYYMIEIEVSGHSGSDQDDYYAFLGDVPPAGAALTVAGKGNVVGNWVDYKDLSAGVKWDFDDNGKLKIEAEDMALKGYKVDDMYAASGGEVIRLKKSEGEASMTFGAESGTYSLELAYVDENDGEGSIEVWIAGVMVHEIELNNNNNGNGNDWSTISTVEIPNLVFNQGDEIVLKGNRDAWEMARIDALTFCDADHAPPPPPPPPEGEVCIEFDTFADGTQAMAGDMGDLSFDGVTFQAIRAQDSDGVLNDAMLFDSDAATASGEDSDLLVGQGNLIIISEDGDSSDPDDNAQGGTVVATFDSPSLLTQVMMVDIEEAGGVVRLYGTDDALLAEVAVPVVGDGQAQWVDLGNVDNVARMEITLPGSGAIGAVKFVPGEPTNAAPDAVDDAVTTDEDSPATLALLDNDTDPDGDTVVITSAGGVAPDTAFDVVTTDGRTVSVLVDASGVMSFDPGADFQEMGVGDTDQFSFTYDITDGNGGTDTATATVTINGVNDGPDAVDDATSTDEDTPVTLALLANDTDPDNDTLMVTQAGGSAAGTSFDVVTTDGRTVSVTVGADGTMSFDPGADFQEMGVGDTDQFSFTYDITDGNGGTDTSTATVTINGLNDGPTAVDDATGTDEDTVVTLDLLANDTDPENDALSVMNAGGAVAGTSFAVTTDGNRTAMVTVTAAGLMTFDPGSEFQALGANDTDQFSFTYDITDGNGGTDTATATVTVQGVNDGPTAVDDAYTVSESAITNLAILANDTDPEDDPLTVELLSSPVEGTITLNTDGTVDFNPGTDFLALSDGQSATVTFDYRISDGEFTDDATVTITVLGEGVCPAHAVVADTELATLFDQSPVTVTLEGPDTTCDDHAGVTLSVEFGDTQNTRYNIVYVVDVSLSTESEMIDGVPVIDAQIQALQNLTADILASGIPPENLTISLVPFNGAALPTQPSDQSGLSFDRTIFQSGDGSLTQTAIDDALTVLEGGGQTNYIAALFATAGTLQLVGGSQPNTENIVYFLSDGNPFPEGSQPPSLLAGLSAQVLPNAKIHGVAIGEVINPDFVDAIDNTGGVAIVRDLDPVTNDALDLLDAALHESTEDPGTILSATLNVYDNGVLADTISFAATDFDETPFGFELNTDLTGIGFQVNDLTTAEMIIELDGNNDNVADDTVTVSVDIQGLLPDSLNV
ncbi:MAG: Ig-like domain-containing protein [Pseudomonadota bacterium]